MQCVQSGVWKCLSGHRYINREDRSDKCRHGAAVCHLATLAPCVAEVACARTSVQCLGTAAGAAKGVWLDQRMQRSQLKHANSAVRHSLLSNGHRPVSPARCAASSQGWMSHSPAGQRPRPSAHQSRSGCSKTRSQRGRHRACLRELRVSQPARGAASVRRPLRRSTEARLRLSTGQPDHSPRHASGIVSTDLPGGMPLQCQCHRLTALQHVCCTQPVHQRTHTVTTATQQPRGTK